MMFQSECSRFVPIIVRSPPDAFHFWLGLMAVLSLEAALSDAVKFQDAHDALLKQGKYRDILRPFVR
jgi:hypothetical protein